jgi:DDE superfamily endonuclease
VSASPSKVSPDSTTWTEPGGTRFFPQVVVAVKSIACELPARLGLPFSRLHIPDIQAEVIRRGLMAQISGIVPFDRLVDEVMAQEPYRSAPRVFWVLDNGSSHRGKASIQRLQAAHGNLVVVHLPIHANWINQTEIYFSILQRKVLTPADAVSLDDLGQRILAFQATYELMARPSEWKFTRADLNKLLARLAAKNAGGDELAA